MFGGGRMRQEEGDKVTDQGSGSQVYSIYSIYYYYMSIEARPF